MDTKAPISGDEDIAIRIEKVKARMRTAIRGSGLAAANPMLVAVSKTIGKKPIEILLRHGHKTYGENRVQEASRKWPELKANYPEAKLHLIGQLQTNKVKEAARLFDVI